MARNRIPDELLTDEQRKKRERNERYRLNQRNKPSTQSILQLVKDDLRQSSNERVVMTPKLKSSQTQTLSHSVPSSVTSIKSFGSERHAKISPQEIIVQKLESISQSWESILYTLLEPGALCLFVLVASLSAYLFYQGLWIFRGHEGDSFAAVSSAIVSESIPIICAGIFALFDQKIVKFVSAIFLIVTVVGLSSFMSEGIVGHGLTQNHQYKSVQQERDVILSSIEGLNKSLSVLPETFVSKRHDLIKEIERHRQELSANTLALNQIKGSHSVNSNAVLGYSVWIRIAAMLLNAFLVHLLFSRLRCRD